NTPVLNKNYSRLWFRADYPLQQATAYLLLDDICVHSGITTAISDIMPAADAPQLFQNTSNPFSDQTFISYYLPSLSQQAFIQVHDVTGKLIRSFTIAGVGKGTITLNAENMQSGIYLYSMIVNGQKIDTKRLVIAR
ncbi:MAG: hypothetical protein JWO06_3761, partial [Bacteroidota bacterium]|nr:hypothetical protein [Bacteroidota bacterium]